MKNLIIVISLGMLFLVGSGGSGNESKDKKDTDENTSVSFQEGEKYFGQNRPDLNSDVLAELSSGSDVKIEREVISSKDLIVLYGEENTRGVPEETAETVIGSSTLQSGGDISEVGNYLISLFKFKDDAYSISDVYYVNKEYREQTKILGTFVAIFIGRDDSKYIYSFYDPRENKSFNLEKYPDKVQKVTEGYFDIKVSIEKYEGAVTANIYSIPDDIVLGSDITEEVKEKILAEGKKITEINLSEMDYILHPLL